MHKLRLHLIETLCRRQSTLSPKPPVPYASGMPKIWTETIEEHRREVRDTVMATTAGLVAEQGLRGVTMSQIAAKSGIGRATLYKYFPDVEAILRAWHEQQISSHLAYLGEVREGAGSAGDRLEAVLRAYALVYSKSREHKDSDLAAFLHRDHQVARAHQQVHRMIRDMLVDAVETGDVRSDVAPEELATYCIHALGAASEERSTAAVARLVALTLAGLRP